MSNIYDNQIKEMQRLINYGRKENTTSNSQSIVEYCAKGADGKTYGIIREGHNFYIKVAPKKNTEILAEDYDYIGGFNNRKENEYSTYTLASKQFDLKLKALNEAYNAKTYSSQYKPTESSEWQINETKEMRRELNRYKQLVENVNNILEGREIVGLNEDSDPYSVKPMYDSKTAKNQIKDGSKSVTVTNKDMQSDKSPKSNGDGGDAYQEKPKYPDVKKGSKKSVADQNPSGGKAVKYPNLKEGRTIKINEEQVLAWSKSKDFMDKSHGTHIGSSSPFSDEVDGCADGTYCEADTEPIHEEVAVHITDDQNSPRPGVSKPRHCGDPFEEKVNEAQINPSEVAGFDDEDDDDYDDELDDLTIKSDSDPDNIGFENDIEPTEPDSISDDLGVTPEEMEKWNITYSPDEEEVGMDDPGNFDPESDYASQMNDEEEDDEPIDPDEDLGEEDPEIEDASDYRDLSPKEFLRVLSPDLSKKAEKNMLAGHFGVKPSKLTDFEEKGNRYWRLKPGKNTDEPVKIKPEPEPEVAPEPEYDQPIDKRIDFDEKDYWNESRRRGNEIIYEVKLDDFGKHPAYRKEVMTLPPNKEIDRYGRDWNDDSAKGDEPFGKQIGSSAPYTEKVVDMLTDAIFNKIKKKV